MSGIKPDLQSRQPTPLYFAKLSKRHTTHRAHRRAGVFGRSPRHFLCIFVANQIDCLWPRLRRARRHRPVPIGVSAGVATAVSGAAVIA